MEKSRGKNKGEGRKGKTGGEERQRGEKGRVKKDGKAITNYKHV